MSGINNFWDYAMEEGVCPNRILQMVKKSYPNEETKTRDSRRQYLRMIRDRKHN